MAINLFGFTIKRNEDEDNTPSFVPETSDDGAVDISGAGAYGTYFDMEGTVRNEAELITRYREMSLMPECELAIDDIINEAINTDSFEEAVNIRIDKLKVSDGIKSKIRREFSEILRLLDFDNSGSEIFKRWYVDGRLYYHDVIDVTNPQRGIQELRYIDPRTIKKVRETERDTDRNATEADLVKKVKEYFIYNEKGISEAQSGIKIAPDSITYVTSGILDAQRKQVLSYLHKAIKPLNQLRMVEDAVVIYRLSRAPERRIFYIDVGNLPKGKAEAYLRDTMQRYKNKLVYDASTGEIRDDKKHMSMLEDYWLPRREGGRGTEISTLPGGSNLGEMDDVLYFQKKLYKSLNVPSSRLESENAFALGRSSEITRDEVKFARFIAKLRKRFSHLFDDLLRKQLILKGIISPEDWEGMKEHIFYDFLQDTYFAELKEAEIIRERLGLLNEIDQYTGKYYSKEWVQRNILQMDEQEMEEMGQKIKDEIASGELPDPSEEDTY
jgi:hypothetical protein